jgi:hypothetical protein
MAWTWTMVSPLLMAKPHLLGYRQKLSHIHRLQCAFVKALSHSDKKSSFQHRHVLVRGMPMRGNLGPIGAPYPQNEGRGFCIHVSREGARSHPLIIGVHFRSPKRAILCASLLSFLSWLKAAIAGAAIDRKTTSDFATTVFLIRFLRLKDWPDLGAPGLAKRYSRPACEGKTCHSRSSSVLSCPHSRHMPVFMRRNRFVEF